MHQAAGSKRVFELHGNETRFYCPECGHAYTLDQIEEQSNCGAALGQCGAVIRPDIVIYGEGLDMDTVYGAFNAISLKRRSLWLQEARWQCIPPPVF